MRRKRQRHRTPAPTIRFTPLAWAKLLWCRDRGPTEIGGFGITSPIDHLLIEDFVLLPQQAAPYYVAFGDEAVAEFFEEQVDRGRRPEQFGRIWIHTHPGNCPVPSTTDEETFERVFGACDWAVMLIVARSGAAYARLEWHVGPHGAIEVPIRVDYRAPFTGSDEAAWQAEFERCVRPLSVSGKEPFLTYFEEDQFDGRPSHAAGISGLAGDGGGPADSTQSCSPPSLDHSGAALGA